MLHIRCGTDIVADLRAGGVPGDILVWDDPLCLGPTPDVLPPEWYRLRAAFIADAFDADPEMARMGLEAAQAALETAVEHDEVVLWFEHDLYDQAILTRLLAWFHAHRPARLSLVTASSHPEVPRFIGLGNLNARQLLELFAHRAPVGVAELAHGSEAWDAWREPDPRHLADLADRPVPGLPYLPAAIHRHLEDLPWSGDGLSRTERLILRAAEADGTGEQVFLRMMDSEQAPWMGDSMCYYVIRELVRLRPALLEIMQGDPPTTADFRQAIFRTSRAGRRVLDGADRVMLTGIDTWVGGVRLEGTAASWRWDPASGRPVTGNHLP